MDFHINPEDVSTLDAQCNCAWMECPSHAGKLCEEMALGIKCPNEDCGEIHTLGDRSIGKGVALCYHCAFAISDVMKNDVPTVMSEVVVYMPDWMSSLNSFVGYHFTDNVEHEYGWKNPFRDTMAALTLACTILKLANYEKKKIPMKLLARVTDTAKKIKDIRAAFHGASVCEKE